MTSPRERTLMLDEFQKNTGTERHEAQIILNRNNWNLNNSYKEIERLCVSSSQKVKHPTSFHSTQAANAGPSQCNPIDVGLGPAVHLSRQSGHSLQHTNLEMEKPNCQLPTRNANAVMASSKDSHFTTVSNYGNSNQPTKQLAFTHSNAECASKERINPMLTPDKRGKPFAAEPISTRKFMRNPEGIGISEGRVVEDSLHPLQSNIVRPEQKDGDDNLETDDVFDEHFVARKSMNSYPRLKRGFSNILENEGIVSEARSNVQIDIKTESHDNMYVQTFVLPNLTIYSGGFRAFMEKELVETSTLVSLEQAGRLNWWAEMHVCQRLMPMATTGDGNCLLHAASLAMWGIHDRQLILRKELHETLTKASYKDALYRRWRYQQTLVNKESCLVFSEAEWKEEWDNILRLASALPRGAPDAARIDTSCDTSKRNEDPVVYESLEEFHVFVLAHVLKRPIIVVADTFLKSSNGEALAPIPFSGIYLPLEVHPCYRSPLLLTYDAAHFSALAPMEQDAKQSSPPPAAIPLVEPDLKLLPVHFYIDPGSYVDWTKNKTVDLSTEEKITLLQKLLDVEKIPLRSLDNSADSDLGSCGSQDSDEFNIVVHEKDRSKEDKKKSTQPFGSFGKSVGRKLKQLGGKSKGDKQTRRPSLGNTITQSTTKSIVDNYNPCDFVLVARLSEKRGKQQQEMIRNYLQDASIRFKHDNELKRRSDIELKSRVAQHPAVSSVTSCKTPDCLMEATEEFYFYCPNCFALKQEEISKFHGRGNQFVYNTFPGRTRPVLGVVQQNPSAEEVFKCGKSKFYTSSNEKIEQNAGTHGNLQVSNMDKYSSRSNENINLNRGRSPSPDYDNVEYTKSSSFHHNGASDNEVSQSTSKSKQSFPGQMKCKTPNCQFYGNPASDFLCSKCFKRF